MNLHGDDSQLADRAEDFEPDADVFDALRNRSPEVWGKLLGVELHLKDIVEEGEERSERKPRDKDGDKGNTV